MKPKLLLTLSSVVIALFGLLGLLVPVTTAYGFEVSMPGYLNATARIPWGFYLGVALMDWLARNAEASRARDAIFIGNTVGYGLYALLIAITVLTPGAQPAGWIAVAMFLIFAAAFFVVGRANLSTRSN